MVSTSRYPLLDRIDSPGDLRRLDVDQLPEVVAEVRRFLIETVSETGGHLAPGLGTVELTVALHYLFNTPDDRIVWDIGHQAYPHKILTGRRDRLSSIRQRGGLSGFLKRSESVYDTFGAGHSSTSISAALGMAVAASRLGIEREVVAVIGDGALTAGMAFEALNNADHVDANLLVVLNDNEMSISRNVGALSNYLARILSGKTYTTVREGSKTVLGTVQPMKNLARRWEEHLKGMVMPSTLFEELGFYYIGPINGHDMPTLLSTLKNLKSMSGPRFLHIVTQKGKGFEPAEGDPCVYHGVSPFDPNTGKIEKKPAGKTYTSVFGDWLCDMAAKDPKLIGITPAMREGSGLVKFSEQYPERYFDVGIAEQHAVTFAAGLACEGLKPVVAIYSTFLQRAYDQLIHDVCIQNLDVTFAIDRAGLVGADGPTHAGAFDHTYLRCIPNMVVMAASDEVECRDMLYTAYLHSGPSAVRYPRGSGPGMQVGQTMTQIPIGTAKVIREGERVAILAFGKCVAAALEAADALNATAVNMRFVKPIDTDLVERLSRSHDVFITVEDNVVAGGAGAAINEYLAATGMDTRVINLGLPDRFVDHGSQPELIAECGLDREGIVNAARSVLPVKFARIF
ncbi:MAG: 1-deoxy-D-xylulose-5-phosphate synthase [marine bacterium B5-7]|nr:MAG: 1-deoxy-D-xylulose-5-phosphate synthase [marine bacterium B5-7]